MRIGKNMDLEALQAQAGGVLTRAELEAVRELLVRLFDGRRLGEVPDLVVQACINHALAGMPDEVPGEFFR